MSEFGSDSGKNSTFRSGLTFTLVGIALAIFLGVVEDWEAATIGLIPIGIGIARLVSWKYNHGFPEESTKSEA
jgi:cadmium resistance protein CadD (predicted permease)